MGTKVSYYFLLIVYFVFWFKS